VLSLNHALADVVAACAFVVFLKTETDDTFEPRRMAGAETDSGTLPEEREEHEL
jgi:hypothetical protein